MNFKRKIPLCEEKIGELCEPLINSNGVIFCKNCGIILDKSVIEYLPEEDKVKQKKKNEVINTLEHYFQLINLNEIQLKQGKEIYQQINGTTIKVKGKKLEKVLLGIVYYICKIENNGLTIKEISKSINHTEQEILFGYKLLEKLIPEIKTGGNGNNLLNSLINKYCISNNFNNYLNQALKISKPIQSVLEGKKPNTIAVVTIFFVLRYYNVLNGSIEKIITTNCDVTISNVRQVLQILDKNKETLEKMLKQFDAIELMKQ
ncbi:Hypothetical protein EHI5A_061870 [Entamoeba histolytica KU27]|uniref:Transcription initiation factor IIB n=1 Tax=Entamoeba histolytica KU27 TaxID=885311 RepID=M2R6G4_ENTHI|nr:Hypothetical protein EHI5A_061870 [Entamoeba histolytica KU27]